MASTEILVASDLAVGGKDGGILHVDIHSSGAVSGRCKSQVVGVFMGVKHNKLGHRAAPAVWV